MGKSYTSDLRERVIGLIEAGQSRRQAARHFGVSPSCAVKLMAHWRRTGSLEPVRQGRPHGGAASAFSDWPGRRKSGHHHAGIGGAQRGHRQSGLAVALSRQGRGEP